MSDAINSSPSERSAEASSDAGHASSARSTNAQHEQRVSVLVGDRLCINCGYNLTGQAVLREPHYQMLIVRCPECATIASMQEYPLLGRWANRWAGVAAALWLGFLLIMWVGSGAAMFGVAMWAEQLAPLKYADQLQLQWQQWAANQMPSTAPVRRMGISGSTTDFSSWWALQDPAAKLSAAGGPLAAMDWKLMLLGSPWLMVPLIFGVFWAVALMNRKRVGLLIWGLMVMLVAGAFAALAIAAIRDDGRSGYAWSGHFIAEQQVGPTALLMGLILQMPAMALGLIIGRPFARTMVRILLPPRLRNSLAMLWLCDDKPLPKAR